MPVLYENKKGMKLETFLQKHKKILEFKRYFYVLSMNLDNHHIKNTDDKKIYKFGIGGINYRNEDINPYPNRLKSYIINFGIHNKKNLCQGVKIHFLFFTEHNRLVETKLTKVHKIETKLKRATKDLRLTYPGSFRISRGTERVFTTFDNLISKIDYDLKEYEAPNRYKNVLRGAYPILFRRVNKRGKYVYLMSNGYEKSFDKVVKELL